MTEPESPASVLWREIFVHVSRTNPRTDYANLMKDAADAANLAVDAYRNAFPIAKAPAAATSKPAPPAKKE